MIYSSTVQELIRTRKSIRSYLDTPIEETKKRELTDVMESFGSESYRFHLIDFAFEEGAKIGTYGMIKGAKAFIVGIMNINKGSDVHASLDFGCAFEKIVLKATDLGLGTCWMGQRKREDLVQNLLDIPDNFRVVAMTPVGIPDETPATKQRKSLENIVSWEKFGQKST